jgi:hypothetical protein
VISKKDVEEIMVGTMNLEREVNVLHKHILHSKARLPFLPLMLQQKEQSFIDECLHGIEVGNKTIAESKRVLTELLKTVGTVARA